MGQFYSRYQFEPFVFGLSYNPSYYWVDGDSYLRRHQLQPEVLLILNADLLTKITYTYNHDTYFDDDERNGSVHGLDVDAWLTLNPDNELRVFGGLGYEINTARGDDYEYGCTEVRAGVSLRVPFDLKVSTELKYHAKDYEKRKDDRYTGALTVSRKVLYQWLEAGLEFNFTRNNSNVDDYAFERLMTTLSLTATY